MQRQDYIEKIAAFIADDLVRRRRGRPGHTAGYWLAESQFRAADAVLDPIPEETPPLSRRASLHPYVLSQA